MTTSPPFSLQNKFSHIYVERAAAAYPLADTVLRRFPKAIRIEIDDYKELFNRSRQDWNTQKESMKIILAMKKDGFLYEGTGVAPSFGYKHFYYNSLVLNCLHDCEYCYLQGMYPSANVVMFVNEGDFFDETRRTLAHKTPLYLCISYDTDLLAFEQIIPYASRWVEFARNHADLIVELRTKSANYSALQHLSPPPNVILAWTLSPQPIIDRFEHKTPSLEARLRALRRALADGWQVRVCIDPMLMVEGYEKLYLELIDEMFASDSLSLIRDVSLGFFRINRDYFKRMKKQRPDSLLLYHPYTTRAGLVGYDSDKERAFVEKAMLRLKTYISDVKIFVNCLSD